MSRDISELHDVPRTRNASYYFALIFLVGPLWCSIPFAWIYVIYALANGKIYTYGAQGKALLVLALAEVIFSVYHQHLTRWVSKSPPFGPGNQAELQGFLTRLLKAGMSNLPEDGFDEESMDGARPGSPAEPIIQLEDDDPRAIDFRNVLRTWFGRAPWSSITLREVRPWIYWAIFNADLPPLEVIPKAHRAAMDEAIELLQKRTGRVIPEGSAPSKIRPLLLTLDKVNIIWRPLTYYAVIAIVNWCFRMKLLRVNKLQHGSYEGLEYLIRIPAAWNAEKDPRPIVFVHGLGVGLLQYNVIITHLVEKFPTRPLLVLLQPHISQNIFHSRYLKPMSRHEATHRLANLLLRLGWADLDPEFNDNKTTDIEEKEVETTLTEGGKKGVTMLSHSNGSYCHAWMLKSYPEMITRSCFIDPVTFCSWEGDVCHNFVYRQCTTGLELIMRYFVSAELGVANFLQRHFDWAANALWYEEIPNARDPTKALFILGGKDAILRADRVKRYLTSHGVREGLCFDPDARHGSALISGGPGHKEVLRWLESDD